MYPVTVLMPVYNAESFLEETIVSILNQTFSDFELLIMDDGSTDRSMEIAKSYYDGRIKIHACNHDFVSTLNTGLALAEGKFIAFADHDDLMVPERIGIQYEFTNSHKDISACGGFMQSFGTESKLMKSPINHCELSLEMIKRSPVLNPTGFIKNDFIKANNIKFERGYSFAADFKFWSDVVKVGKMGTIPEVLTLYRKSENQASTKYLKESDQGAEKVKLEMALFFLSRINGKHVCMISDKLKNIDDISPYSFDSNRTLLDFLYEVIYINKKLIC